MKKILESANSSPSAGNLQSYSIFSVTGRDVLTSLAYAAGNQSFIEQASLCLVFSADLNKSATEYGRRGSELYCVQDATIAAVFVLLKAVDLGYSTSWIGAFDEKRVAEIIGGGDLIPVAIILVGISEENPVHTSRRKLEHLMLAVNR